MRILITGGCGFIGNQVVRRTLMIPGVERVVNVDALTYSGNLDNCRDIIDERYRFVNESINNKSAMERVIEDEQISVLIHLAAESHVDRSINSVQPFVETNIDGTRVLLESIVHSKKSGTLIHFIHVSTDEVYGSLEPNDPPFTEKTPLNPQNPYAATKAASDMLVQAFVNTHDISAVITRSSNNFGPRQFPEKLIPLMTINAMKGKALPIYGDGKQIRDWIHVDDHASGILSSMLALVVGQIPSGEVFNFGAANERTNIEIVQSIVKKIGAKESLISFVEDRPGHDRRYAMGYEKAERILGWRPEIVWETGLSDTIEWYTENKTWIDSITSGEYRKYIKNQYGIDD